MNQETEKSRDELILELTELRAQMATVSGERQTSDVQTASAHVLELEVERGHRAEAERIGQIKDEFLANLSHELRNPMNAICGWVELLRPGQSTDEEMTEGLDVIRRNTRAQVKLIDDLLDMSRIISGKMRLDIQRVEHPAIIQSVVDSMHLAATAKGVRVEVLVDPVAGPVTGDPARIQQVVLNLLSNAVKFTPRGGKVQVTLERVDSNIELSVSDTGRGITASFLPYVFDRFRQAESTAGKSYGGLGLGLAIVKSLVELHGGSVRVKSPGEGKGATFIVSIPISVVRTMNGGEDRQHPTTFSGIEFTSDADLSGVRVMVVEDDPDALDLVTRVLEGCKAKVTGCTSASACMEMFQDVRPHVLVSDIGMPVMDGYSLVRQVRALSLDEGGETPAVALTGFARSEDRRRAMQAGFDMHVTKPVEPGELVAVIARMARRAGATAEAGHSSRGAQVVHV
jgi:signal transduction histidine kinase/CheY-like chemotaxis protein